MFNPFKKTFTDEELGLFSFLRRTALFAKLDDNELFNFLPYMYLRKYSENEVVFFRHDPSHALYLINKGLISISLDLNSEFEKIGQFSKGNAFGSSALIEGAKRNYHAIVESQGAELFVIPHVNIRDILAEHPQIAAKMLGALSKLYDEYTKTLYQAYQSSLGFFAISQAPINW